MLITTVSHSSEMDYGLMEILIFYYIIFKKRHPILQYVILNNNFIYN